MDSPMIDSLRIKLCFEDAEDTSLATPLHAVTVEMEPLDDSGDSGIVLQFSPKVDELCPSPNSRIPVSPHEAYNLSSSSSTSTPETSPIQQFSSTPIRLLLPATSKASSVKRKLSESRSGISPCHKKTRFSHLIQNTISCGKSSFQNKAAFSHPIPNTNTSNTQAADANIIRNTEASHRIPTVEGAHADLKYITPDTLQDLLTGNANLDEQTDFKVIDCRYPFEHEGGHIQGSLNLHSQDKLTSLVNEYHSSDSHSKNTMLIFHCEFSSERGPKRARFLRNLDRQLNGLNYPRLNFPEVYILKGGYKAFFEQFRHQCTPQAYVPMLDKTHREDMKRFRCKSKSWSAGDRSSKQKRSKCLSLKMRLEY